MIPFIINIIYLFIKIRYKIKKTEEPPLNLRKSFLKLYKYGLPFSVKDFGDILVRELYTQSVGIFESPEIVTGYNIGINFSNVGSYSINSFGHPLSVSFTRLYAIKKIDEVVKIYQTLFHYILFIVLIISGFLFFVIDFFLFLIYGETYLDFSLILKIMIISIIFNIQNLFFYGLIRATNKGKKIIPIYLLLVPLKIVCFIIIIMYFGIISALISLMILNFIYFIALLILSYKIFKIKTNVIKVLFQYISFFVSLGITILLNYAFLNNLNNILLNLIHLSYFKYLNIFSILVFCFSYIILNFIFKIITKKDLNNIELLLEKKNFVFKLVKKALNLFKKLVRD
ncbi:MAG: lipopolysaccharide biosynthesis protein [Promethearchaeota archaeon]